MINFKKMAEEHRPKMITVGASAYSTLSLTSRAWVKVMPAPSALYLLADIAHIAGLGRYRLLHPSPVAHADFVTTTTHQNAARASAED